MNYKYLSKTVIVAAVMVSAAFAQTVTTFEDSRDGKTYKAVKIGKQIWMAENLNFAADESKCYKNEAENCEEYGRMYNWDTAIQACPAGYHLPTAKEWNELERSAGGSTAGPKLLSKCWRCYNTDEYAFSALLGGYGCCNGVFRDAGVSGFWWTATESNAKSASCRQLYPGWLYVNSLKSKKTELLSVRCVRN